MKKGEFIANVSIDKDYLRLPYFHIKKTKNEKIDYPLITAAGLKKDGLIRIAFSGLAPFPFRDARVEGIINDRRLKDGQKADKIADELSDIISDDLSGSAQYRKFVLKNIIVNVLEIMKDK